LGFPLAAARRRLLDPNLSPEDKTWIEEKLREADRLFERDPLQIVRAALAGPEGVPRGEDPDPGRFLRQPVRQDVRADREVLRPAPPLGGPFWGL
jgi:hypothetical protein